MAEGSSMLAFVAAPALVKRDESTAVDLRALAPFDLHVDAA
jgi:hypothetical protein